MYLTGTRTNSTPYSFSLVLLYRIEPQRVEAPRWIRAAACVVVPGHELALELGHPCPALPRALRVQPRHQRLRVLPPHHDLHRGSRSAATRTALLRPRRRRFLLPRVDVPPLRNGHALRRCRIPRLGKVLGALHPCSGSHAGFAPRRGVAHVCALLERD
jgi:hypothetical protein